MLYSVILQIFQVDMKIVLTIGYLQLCVKGAKG
jgi:hypothetical protein